MQIKEDWINNFLFIKNAKLKKYDKQISISISDQTFIQFDPKDFKNKIESIRYYVNSNAENIKNSENVIHDMGLLNINELITLNLNKNDSIKCFVKCNVINFVKKIYKKCNNKLCDNKTSIESTEQSFNCKACDKAEFRELFVLSVNILINFMYILF